MSDNIDYDELDKAVSEAIKSRATTSKAKNFFWSSSNSSRSANRCPKTNRATSKIYGFCSPSS